MRVGRFLYNGTWGTFSSASKASSPCRGGLSHLYRAPLLILSVNANFGTAQVLCIRSTYIALCFVPAKFTIPVSTKSGLKMDNSVQPFDFDKPARIECDASDGATGAVLSQPDTNSFSRMTLAECNYDIYDKALLAIVKAFEQWRAELEGNPLRS